MGMYLEHGAINAGQVRTHYTTEVLSSMRRTSQELLPTTALHHFLPRCGSKLDFKRRRRCSEQKIGQTNTVIADDGSRIVVDSDGRQVSFAALGGGTLGTGVASSGHDRRCIRAWLSPLHGMITTTTSIHHTNFASVA